MEEEGIVVSVGVDFASCEVWGGMCRLFIDGEALPHRAIDDGVVIELDFDKLGVVVIYRAMLSQVEGESELSRVKTISTRQRQVMPNLTAHSRAYQGLCPLCKDQWRSR